MATYLETYLHCKRDLPNDIHRIMALIGVLDEKALEKRALVARLYDQLHKMSSVEGKDPHHFAVKLKQLRKDQKEIHSLNEDKLQLVHQANYYVLTFMERLDRDLSKFEAEIGSTQEKQVEEESPPRVTCRPPRRRAEETSSRKRQRVESDNEQVFEFDNSAANVTTNKQQQQHHQQQQQTEEVYCICRRGYYGNMIACDGPNCRIEWFHFECVGLREQPKGKWFCPSCRPAHGGFSYGSDF